jgi:hypothetical protein
VVGGAVGLVVGSSEGAKLGACITTTGNHRVHASSRIREVGGTGLDPTVPQLMSSLWERGAPPGLITRVGVEVGTPVGSAVGVPVGDRVGPRVGRLVLARVGLRVGAVVGILQLQCSAHSHRVVLLPWPTPRKQLTPYQQATRAGKSSGSCFFEQPPYLEGLLVATVGWDEGTFVGSLEGLCVG